MGPDRLVPDRGPVNPPEKDDSMSSIPKPRRFASATEWLASVVIPPDSSPPEPSPVPLAIWLDAQAERIRDRSLSDDRNLWLAARIADLAANARLVDAKTTAQYDERIQVLEAERDFALRHAVYAADLAGVDVQAALDPDSVVD
jgi:hypothetical protein